MLTNENINKCSDDDNNINFKNVLSVVVGCLIGLIFIRFYGFLTQYMFIGENWPLWMTFTNPTFNEIIFAVIILGIGITFFAIEQERFNLKLIILAGFLLIIGSNLIPGWEEGITLAIMGGSELYSDAIQITSITDFIGNYQNMQFSLSVHAQTHPPGAILVIYILNLIFNSPDLVGISLCLISTGLTTFFFNGILRRYYDLEISNFITILLLVLPAVQIYYLANIYAFVVSLILGSIYFYFHSDPVVSHTGTIICLFLGSFISFMTVFALILIVLYELSEKRTLKALEKAIDISIVIFGLYTLLYIFLGFNYIQTFVNASLLENREGFMLLADPQNYLLTRIQDILEIIIFYGPVLLVITYKGLKLLKQNDDQFLCQITRLAIVSLSVLFLLGVYKKGETARAAMYIFPFLLIPVASFFENLKKKDVQTRKSMMYLLLVTAFLQSIIMQLMGNYIW